MSIGAKLRRGEELTHPRTKICFITYIDQDNTAIRVCCFSGLAQHVVLTSGIDKNDLR